MTPLFQVMPAITGARAAALGRSFEGGAQDIGRLMAAREAWTPAHRIGMVHVVRSHYPPGSALTPPSARAHPTWTPCSSKPAATCR